MQHSPNAPDALLPPKRVASSGFTLIEVMVVIAIIGILAAVALPIYRDHILRGQLVDATNLLSAGRANMERYYQDNRTYAAVGTTATPPCASSPTLGKFTLTCTGSGAPTATSYLLTATGSGPVAGFSFTVDPTGVQATPAVGVAGWNTSTTCWITKKGQTC